MADTELIFVSGKGGTGKSALTAALALDRARRGHSVLAVDMGASLGLGTHLREPVLSYQPKEVRPGLFAMTIERSTALDEYLKLQLRVPQGAPTRQLAAALGVLADTAPGVREIISIGKPVHETWKGTWDTVVVDAPSLGQFQSYLRAPTTIAELVPTGNVKRQATKLQATVLDPDVTSIVLVATPAELPVNETNEAIEAIAVEGLSPPPTVVVNRLLPKSGMQKTDLDLLGSGPVFEAAALQVSMETEQESWCNALPHDYTLPFLRGILTPEEVAVQLADAIAGM
ncbi:MAG: ArsA family ATPase [Acidimicrobiia bacterium]